jgi:hypothetical protein
MKRTNRKRRTTKNRRIRIRRRVKIQRRIKIRRAKSAPQKNASKKPLRRIRITKNRKIKIRRTKSAPQKNASKELLRRIRIRRIPRTQRQSALHGKALDALGRMRRLGWSLNKAAKLEHIKSQTILRHVGRALYRSGPGKPWKATKSDRLTEKMAVLTQQGPVFAVVRSSIERTRLSRYNTALRKWRAAEGGASQELMAFEGQTVAGYILITDPDVLIRLEEAGQLDFDAFYYSLGGGQ